MFPLILNIVLGILLLLVILLLISELIATYPVWKQFQKFYATQPDALAPMEKGSIKRGKFLLLALGSVSAIFLLAYLLSQFPGDEKEPSQVKAETVAAKPPVKHFTAASADSAVFFRLQTKWEDGKLYGNSTLTFATGVVQPVTECQYFLLDKEGFLIKAVSFSSNDFLFSTAPDGKAKGLLNKFNTPLSIDDYLKIETLQVALDGKVASEK